MLLATECLLVAEGCISHVDKLIQLVDLGTSFGTSTAESALIASLLEG